MIFDPWFTVFVVSVVLLVGFVWLCGLGKLDWLFFRDGFDRADKLRLGLVFGLFIVCIMGSLIVSFAKHSEYTPVLKRPIIPNVSVCSKAPCVTIQNPNRGE